MVLEINLNNFVAKSEHDGVTSSHPLLHIDDVLHFANLDCVGILVLFDDGLRFVVTLKVRPEMLKQSYLLL